VGTFGGLKGIVGGAFGGTTRVWTVGGLFGVAALFLLIWDLLKIGAGWDEAYGLFLLVKDFVVIGGGWVAGFEYGDWVVGCEGGGCGCGGGGRGSLQVALLCPGWLHYLHFLLQSIFIQPSIFFE